MADIPVPPGGELILYQTEDGRTRIECRFEQETIGLTQGLMADLFQKDVRTINEHLQNIFEEGELVPEATIRKFRIVRRPPQGAARSRGGAKPVPIAGGSGQEVAPRTEP